MSDVGSDLARAYCVYAGRLRDDGSREDAESFMEGRCWKSRRARMRQGASDLAEENKDQRQTDREIERQRVIDGQTVS